MLEEDVTKLSTKEVNKLATENKRVVGVVKKNEDELN